MVTDYFDYTVEDYGTDKSVRYYGKGKSGIPPSYVVIRLSVTQSGGLIPQTIVQMVDKQVDYTVAHYMSDVYGMGQLQLIDILTQVQSHAISLFQTGG